MSNPRIDALKGQFEDVKAGIDSINRAAVEAARDLTPEEVADLDALFERAEALKPEIEREAAREESLSNVSNVLARVSNRGVAMPEITRSEKPADLTAGEYLAEFYRAFHPNGDSAPESFVERAGAYIDRAVQATADTTGVLPTPIVGEAVKLADSLRPVFASFTSRGMPVKGKTFERPRIDQRVAFGTQTEGTAAASQKMILTSDTVTKSTQAGYLDITQQDIDWTEPDALQIVVSDFVDMYAEWTEGLACSFLEGLPALADAAVNGDGYSAYVNTNTGTIVDSYVDAIVDVYNRSKRFPDTAWLALDAWAELASTHQSNNDITAIELLRSTLGQMGVPMTFVVGPQLSSGVKILGASSLVEAYEQQKGLLRAELPSTLSVQIAYSGYTAFWAAHEGIVKLGADPTP